MQDRNSLTNSTYMIRTRETKKYVQTATQETKLRVASNGLHNEEEYKEQTNLHKKTGCMPREAF